MKLKKLGTCLVAAAMCASAFGGALSADALSTTLTISAIDLDISATYNADRAQIARALKIDESDDAYTFLPATDDITVDGVASYAAGSVTIDGTATGALSGTASRNLTYDVTDVAMTVEIAGTEYEGTYDAATGDITIEYTTADSTVDVKIVELAITAGATTCTYDVTDDGVTCTVVLSDGFEYSFTNPAALEVTGSATAKIGDEDADALVVTYTGDGMLEVTVAPAESDVEGFVERLYAEAFGREADEAGLAFWVDALEAQTITGGDAARFFLTSDEYVASNPSDADFIATLYTVFFDREADEAGAAFWTEMLANGAAKEDIINMFIDTPEWIAVCAAYGIQPGTNEAPVPTEGVAGFVARLYTVALDRAADADGAAYWTAEIESQNVTGSFAAKCFFGMGEYTSKHKSNEAFVADLYAAIMGRAADAEGLAFFTAELDNGASMDSVIDMFTGSAEWAAICASYGIAQ